MGAPGLRRAGVPDTPLKSDTKPFVPSSGSQARRCEEHGGAGRGDRFRCDRLDVFGHRIGHRKMNTLRLAPVPLQVKPHRLLIAILVRVGDVQRAAGLDARRYRDRTLESRAPAALSGIRRCHRHQLPRTGCGEGAGPVRCCVLTSDNRIYRKQQTIARQRRCRGAAKAVIRCDLKVTARRLWR